MKLLATHLQHCLTNASVKCRSLQNDWLPKCRSGDKRKKAEMAGPRPQNVTRTYPQKEPQMDTTREEKTRAPKDHLAVHSSDRTRRDGPHMGRSAGSCAGPGAVEASRCSLMPHWGRRGLVSYMKQHLIHKAP